MTRLLQALVTAGSVLVLPGRAPLHRPPPADVWWAGVDRGSPDLPGDFVSVLRSSPRGRVRIPGGTFTMGSTRAAMARALELCAREIRGAQCHNESVLAMVNAEGIAHSVTLSAFELDRTEVTVSDYMRCTSAGACPPPASPVTDRRFASPDLPVTLVRWEDAVAYCRWAGGRLPSEAEWEYAARGTEGRVFPWGDVYNTYLANHGAAAADPTDATDGFAALAPVGSFPDGRTPLGLEDMAGNAAEWVADVFEFDGAGVPLAYDGSPETDPQPKMPRASLPSGTGGAFHVVRGGSYVEGPMWLRSAARSWTPFPRSASVGFRCAADVR